MHPTAAYLALQGCVPLRRVDNGRLRIAAAFRKGARVMSWKVTGDLALGWLDYPVAYSQATWDDVGDAIEQVMPDHIARLLGD